MSTITNKTNITDKQIGLMKFISENIEIQQFVRLYRFHRLNNVVVFLKDV
jgi:hypothetical protein